MNDLRYTQWQASFVDAITEIDSQKLAVKVEKVEGTIFDRFQALSSDSNHHEERQALTDAVATLRILKRDKLAFPDWKT